MTACPRGSRRPAVAPGRRRRRPAPGRSRQICRGGGRSRPPPRLGPSLRTEGRPVRKAAPLTLAMLRQLVATCDASPRGRRDRALLLLFGFAGALRRSELVALQVGVLGSNRRNF